MKQSFTQIACRFFLHANVFRAHGTISMGYVTVFKTFKMNTVSRLFPFESPKFALKLIQSIKYLFRNANLNLIELINLNRHEVIYRRAFNFSPFSINPSHISNERIGSIFLVAQA